MYSDMFWHHDEKNVCCVLTDEHRGMGTRQGCVKFLLSKEKYA